MAASHRPFPPPCPLLRATKENRAMQVTQDQGARPIKNWAVQIEDAAMQQAKNLARLPFIAHQGVALMPDAHSGKGSTIGSVIATEKAIIPAAVGVDLGCGMNAVRLSLTASNLPDSLLAIRQQIERDVPLGAGGAHQESRREFGEYVAHLPDIPA